MLRKLYKDRLFSEIKQDTEASIHTINFSHLKTHNGNTQNSEKISFN